MVIEWIELCWFRGDIDSWILRFEILQIFDGCSLFCREEIMILENLRFKERKEWLSLNNFYMRRSEFHIVYWLIISIISFIFFDMLFFSIFDLFTQSGYSLAISIYLISSIINNFDIVYLHSLEQQSYFTHIYVFSIYLTTFYYRLPFFIPKNHDAYSRNQYFILKI